MASKLSKAMQEHRPYITINSIAGKQWRDFTLQSGHVYGYAPSLYGLKGGNGCFVVRREQTTTIEIYVCVPSFTEPGSTGTCNEYRWPRCVITKESKAGKLMLEVLSRRVGDVSYGPIKEQVKAVYDPPILRPGYTPMYHMRIPGGTFKNVMLEESDRSSERVTGMGVITKNIEDRLAFLDRQAKIEERGKHELWKK